MNHDLRKSVKMSQVIHTLSRIEIIFVTHTPKLCVKGTTVTFPKKSWFYTHMSNNGHINTLGFNFLIKVKTETDDDVKSKHITQE